MVMYLARPSYVQTVGLKNAGSCHRYETSRTLWHAWCACKHPMIGINSVGLLKV